MGQINIPGVGLEFSIRDVVVASCLHRVKMSALSGHLSSLI